MPERPDHRGWIRGRGARCDPEPAAAARAWRLVLLGAPGVGKGTQAELIAARLGPCQLSTGDLFRAARTLPACDRSPALQAALEAMRRGELASDDTVLAMIRERVECLRCQGGFVLDGFPRTVAQAGALEDILRFERVGLDGVLCYEMPIERVVRRLAGRRCCGACHAVFHLETSPPEREGVCDRCGRGLAAREDDAPQAVRRRLEAYERDTAPLVHHYAERGLLRSLSAEGAPEEVYGRMLGALRLVS